ncbi:putative membrane protein [Escherichia coli p0305293.3]|uniref:Uncharacterized protein n=1 Tax=Escherichia coli O81 (strain ED1a) TaxID=585397 RepID=B7LII6_ECO81|nr:MULTISPECIES: hypothetical protein [Enterobacteriaceae]END26631.1 putative membrane protein [Escherichia coli p0305293.13]ENG67294.1 putative membrane protein [Escherichia coli p0305293.3]ENH45737.1 putative membrane protein [Escherichia coli p0305293.6]CAQ87254.1 hypothetical protein, putative membrane protein [Escherichia coli ED1a]
MHRFLPFNKGGFMDFMSILGRCLLLPFPVAMFVGCLFPGIDDRFTGMFMSFIVGCLSWYITKPKPQKAEVA